ncbi:MAG: Gfo/Idh/MocA family oxidoreductase [Flavitalea sp.]
MSKIIRWGIIGCGKIARKFAADLPLAGNAALTAVASRSADNAKQFAAEFNSKKFYTNYEDLVKDPEVDIIYIATPHSHHYQNTLLCLHENKAVLCEKAFAVNSKQAKEMVALARQKKVFMMEALWTRFLPAHIKMLEILKEGLIGEIKSVLINFGFRPLEPIAPRIYDPALAGGTLLDIGIYNVFIAMSILGKPDSINAQMVQSASGVDAQCSIVFQYKTGAVAQLFSTFLSDLSTEANIAGTNGRIKLTSRFFAPESKIEYYPGRIDDKQMIISEDVSEGFGYQYEARHVGECFLQGITESPLVSLNDTLTRMEVLDEIRKKAGIKYPADE